jgi:hypothetical protein
MKYTQTIAFLILFLVSGSQSVLNAQEDSWWRKLFKKETVDDLEEEKDAKMSDPVPAISTEETLDEKDTINVVPWSPNEEGEIRSLIPDELHKLDSSFRYDPIPLQGYRIQIFFGNLKEAKSVRSTFIQSHTEQPCYLVRSAPNFSVRVGDFRTEMNAYKTLIDFKDTFPDAYIVRDEIEIPELKEAEF